MKLNLINGNGQKYKTDDLTIVIKQHLSDTHIENLKEKTGMVFKNKHFNDWAVAKPKSAMQVVKLLTMASTYCFKIGYTDNWNSDCTLFFSFEDRKEKE